MAEPSWAATGPSRPTASSFVSAAAPTATKKKRGRFSDGNKSNTVASIPSIVNPPSPELVPRHSSSASSWGIEDDSDSDGDYDWPTPTQFYAAPSNVLINASPDLDRDELAKFARPSKRVHLETPDDRHTYGKMAGLHIDPSTLAASVPNQSSFGRPQAARSNSGVAGAFGLSASLASAFGASASGLTPAPRVPPSSPTKSDNLAFAFGASASPFYQQAVAPAPPTSPRLADRGPAPPTSPMHSHGFDDSTYATRRSEPADLDSEMRLRRGVPSSYEVEPDRIIVTSLDDTSSSEGDVSSEAEGQKTPDGDTSTESRDSSSDFVINNELMEKLEAHSRAVLTGTSERDNAASNTRSGGASASASRSRRTGRRSAGTAVPSLGSLLSGRRRSAASSPGSSGYASPINAEDARGALILWKDPKEVLRSTSVTTSSPLKPSDLATVPESEPAPSSFMNQPPVAFQSASSFSAPSSNSPNYLGNSKPNSPAIPGMAALASPSESPLYAQQSSLSSSYFPESSALEARFNQSSQHMPLAFGSAPGYSPTAPRSHHDHSASGYGQYTPSSFNDSMVQTSFGGHPQQQQQQQPPHYGQSYSSPAMFLSYNPSAQQAHQHAHASGAQPIDLSGCFGPAEEMDLDS